MDDVISLGVGEPDFVTPPHILQAGVDSLGQGETHYTSNYGLMELREAVAEYLSEHYGVQYDPQTEILLTAGVSEAVDIALRAVIDPGDEVIVPEPAYVSYRPCITFAGGEPVGIDSSAATSFRITATQIADAITPRTKALLLGFPANPTGAMLPRDEWLQIVALARQHNLIMLSDEIYGRLAYTMEHTCVSALPGAWDRTILLGGFSKVLCHDRLAHRLCSRPEFSAGIHHEGAPVRADVRADHEPVRGPAGRTARRAGRLAHAR